MNDDEIVIKPADKGNDIVVWSKKDYLMEASSQSKNRTVYQKGQSAPIQKVKDILRDMPHRKEINKNIMDYLLWKNHN